jgi:hypothetical protein
MSLSPHERMDNGPPDGDFAAYVERLTKTTSPGATQQAAPDAPTASDAKPAARTAVLRKLAKQAAMHPAFRPAPTDGRTDPRPDGAPAIPDALAAQLRRWLKVAEYGAAGLVVLFIGIVWLAAVLFTDHPTDYGWVPILLLAVGFKLMQLARRARSQRPSRKA